MAKTQKAHWLIRELEPDGAARLLLVVEGQEHAITGYDFPNWQAADDALCSLQIKYAFKRVKKEKKR